MIEEAGRERRACYAGLDAIYHIVKCLSLGVDELYVIVVYCFGMCST